MDSSAGTPMGKPMPPFKKVIIFKKEKAVKRRLSFSGR